MALHNSLYTPHVAPPTMQHYAVMDASQNQVFLAVQHAENETVNLYISDREGIDYSLSLNDVVAAADWTVTNPRFDIHVVGHLRQSL